MNIDEPKINFVLQSTKFETKRVTEDIIPIIRLPEVSNSTMKNETIKNGMNLNTHVPLDNQDITIITTTTTTTSDIEMEKSTFDISNETLKMVLIGKRKHRYVYKTFLLLF